MTSPKISPIKLRQILVTLHLLFAGFMAPAFLLVAISGGLYLLGFKGQTTAQVVELPASASLDFTSKTLEADVRALLADAGVEHRFEYVKTRGDDKIHLRPTSRRYIEMQQTNAGLTAALVTPNLQAAMMELHSGHGPKLFKLYQKFVAAALLLVIFGGVMVGLLARAYRRKTIAALGFGTLVFWVLAVFV
ncbi:MAG: hypothetical protein COA91_09855 [Robiginitomaculum sp.]|nr:MAG: hypothetical protein COA91_09855 [Robiginitomaculum sp.]